MSHNQQNTHIIKKVKLRYVVLKSSQSEPTPTSAPTWMDGH
jgi:hypothetical protein